MGKAIVQGLAFMAVAIIGSLVGFFSAGPALFGDGAPRESILVMVIAAAVYLVLAVVAAAALDAKWKLVALLLAAPVVIVVRLFGKDAPLIASMFALNAFAASFLGAWVGVSMRRRFARA